jgi:hypothetical protein
MAADADAAAAAAPLSIGSRLDQLIRYSLTTSRANLELLAGNASQILQDYYKELFAGTGILIAGSMLLPHNISEILSARQNIVRLNKEAVHINKLFMKSLKSLVESIGDVIQGGATERVKKLYKILEEASKGDYNPAVKPTAQTLYDIIVKTDSLELQSLTNLQEQRVVDVRKLLVQKMGLENLMSQFGAAMSIGGVNDKSLIDNNTQLWNNIAMSFVLILVICLLVYYFFGDKLKIAYNRVRGLRDRRHSDFKSKKSVKKPVKKSNKSVKKSNKSVKKSNKSVKKSNKSVKKSKKSKKSVKH